MTTSAIHRLLMPAAGAATLALALGACGGSDKPGYCADRENLQKAVDGLSTVNVRENGIAALKEQLEKIRADAAALAASGKDEFASQTEAITISVGGMRSAVTAFPSSPSAQDAAQLAAHAASVVASVKDFTKATSDACS
jgi:hypothetical protein